MNLLQNLGKRCFPLYRYIVMDYNPKIAFLASNSISSESILRCYDWATEMVSQGRCVVSGFSSKLEKDVLHFLLKGKQPIILVLGREMYKKLPEEFIEPLNSDRLQIISVSSSPRQTKQTAFERNKQIVEMADEIVFASLNEQSSLYALYEYAKQQNKPITLL